MKDKLLTFIFLIFFSFTSLAQQSMLPPNDEVLVKNTIIELFDGYRDGDSLRVKNSFTYNATMQTAYFDKSGQSQLSKATSISNFVSYIGSGLDKEHDERIWDIEVKIDNNLATVWAKYAFYLDGSFSHCGAENFLLLKQNNQWKIFHLVDTRQKADCTIPDSIK
jgi:hypothetical protein